MAFTNAASAFYELRRKKPGSEQQEENLNAPSGIEYEIWTNFETNIDSLYVELN